jgi:hypothetical protein
MLSRSAVYDSVSVRMNGVRIRDPSTVRSYCSHRLVFTGSCHIHTANLSADQKQLYSVASVRERTIAAERPPLVSEVSANFCGYRVSCGKSDGSPRPYFLFYRPEPLLFLPISSSIVLTRLSVPRSRPTTSQKI